MERNEAREVSVFGGQGVASGQLAELRRISQVDEVRRFVKYLSGIFEGEMARNGRRGVPQGLNISVWAVSKELSPDMAYLETLPVSVVLSDRAEGVASILAHDLGQGVDEDAGELTLLGVESMRLDASGVGVVVVLHRAEVCGKLQHGVAARVGERVEVLRGELGVLLGDCLPC